MAAFRGRVEVVELLLSAPGIDVNIKDQDGSSLSSAVCYGHTKVVELLLAAPGIDVNNLDDDLSSLAVAAFKGRTEIVKVNPNSNPNP